MLPAPAGLGWGCITGGRIGSIRGGLTGGDRRVHHWVQHRTRHRASGEGVRMVAPVASANRASAEDEGSLINIKVIGAKKKRRKDVSRPAIQYGITQASVRGLCWWFDGLVGGERSPDCDATRRIRYVTRWIVVKPIG